MRQNRCTFNKCRIRLFPVALALLFGIVCTYAISLRCFTLGYLDESTARLKRWGGPSIEDLMWWTSNAPPGMSVPTEVYTRVYDGYELRAFLGFAPDEPTTQESRRYRAGWPLAALGGEWYIRTPPTTSTRTRQTDDWRGMIVFRNRVTYMPRSIPFLPMRPVWPGFAVNTLFYTAILWVLFAVPGAVRRRWRVKRGLCPACAYPIGASNVCTECGKAVKHDR